MHYVLLKGETKVKEIEASCYTTALIASLKELGYILEALGTEVVEKVSLPVVDVTPSKPTIKNIDLTGKAKEVYEMLLKEELTFEEIAQRTQLRLSTVKTYITYLFKTKGIVVKANSFPGRGIVYKVGA